MTDEKKISAQDTEPLASSHNLYVGNPSWNTDERALKDVYEYFGPLDHAKIERDP